MYVRAKARMLPNWLERLWRSLSGVGLCLGTLFFAASLTPSLIPRGFLIQGALSGLCFAIGYGIGIAWQWLWRFLQLPEPGERELPAKTPRMLEHSAAVLQAKLEHRVRPRPDAETDAEILDWKKRAAPVHKHNARRTSRAMATTTIIQLAEQYADHSAISP